MQMKKASKAILGGLVGVVGAGAAQAGIIGGAFIVPPGVGLDVSHVCKPDFEASWETYGCTYEVSIRCDGEGTDTEGLDYGVCIAGSFAESGFLAASWGATQLTSDADVASCEDNDYGFYGFLTAGVGGDLLGFHGFDLSLLSKMESKITNTANGNGKPDHPGNKGDETGTTVEVEFKFLGCE